MLYSYNVFQTTSCINPRPHCISTERERSHADIGFGLIFGYRACFGGLGWYWGLGSILLEPRAKN